MKNSQKDQLALLQRKERELVIKIAKEANPEHEVALEALGEAVNRYYEISEQKQTRVSESDTKKAENLRERIEKKKEIVAKHLETLDKYRERLAELDPTLRKDTLEQAQMDAEEQIGNIYLESLVDADLQCVTLKELLPKPFLEVVIAAEEETDDETADEDVEKEDADEASESEGE